MKKINLVLFVFAALVLTSFMNVDNEQEVKDYLNIPGPIKFDNKNYNLAWSSRPADNYYKQEYLAKGDSLTHFNKMVIIDVLDDTVTLKDLVYLKIHALENRKKIDAAVSYNLIESPDSSEYILDFSESEGMPKVDFAEWNVYRYKTFKDNAGHAGVMLFGISVRAYGDKVPSFIGSLRDLRETITSQLISYKIPPVLIAAD